MPHYRDIGIYIAGCILAFALVRGVVKDMGKWNERGFKMAVAIIALLSWIVVIAITIGVITKPPKKGQT